MNSNGSEVPLTAKNQTTTGYGHEEMDVQRAGAAAGSGGAPQQGMQGIVPMAKRQHSEEQDELSLVRHVQRRYDPAAMKLLRKLRGGS